MRDLYHVTLETGDAAMIPASHVQPKTLDVMRGILDQLARGQPAAIPAPGEWRVRAGVSGRCLSASIEAKLGGEWLPVVWMGVAKHSRCGDGLWRAMHRLALPAKTRADRQPATPWLASRMMPGAALVRPESLMWIADFEECLAWAWMKSNEREAS